jgi:hypothetical protein
MARIRNTQLNVEFGYQIRIFSKTEGNIDLVDWSQQMYKYVTMADLTQNLQTYC